MPFLDEKRPFLSHTNALFLDKNALFLDKNAFTVDEKVPFSFRNGEKCLFGQESALFAASKKAFSS